VPPSGTAPPGQYAASIAPYVAAAWVEQVCDRAVAAFLAPGFTTVGVGLQLTVAQEPPVAVGTPAVATAWVAQINPDWRTLVFEVSISDGQRELVKAKHSRMVVGPRPHH